MRQIYVCWNIFFRMINYSKKMFPVLRLILYQILEKSSEIFSKKNF